MAVEHMTRGELERLQQRKLQKLLRYAVLHVPFYRNYAQEHHWHIDALSLEQFPVLDKAAFRSHEAEFISDEYDICKLDCCRTSGSTGEPFRFYSDSQERTYTYTTFWRGLARYGIHPGDKRAWVKGLEKAGRQKITIRQKLWTTINRCCLIDAHFLSASQENIRLAVARLQKYNPDYLHGYISSIYDIGAWIKSHNINAREIFPRLRLVVSESEKLHDFQRVLLEEVFQVPVIENYGSVEFGMIAQFDKEGILRTNDDHLVIESIRGEAVMTNLESFSFPFIRFRNGDLFTLREINDPQLPYSAIEKITGRSTEFILLPDGGKIHGFSVLYPVSKHMQRIRSYQIHQTAPDTLLVHIVPTGEGVSPEISGQIIREIQEIVGTKMNITIDLCHSIPLSRSGKCKFVINDLVSSPGNR